MTAYIDSGNATVSHITETVASIKVTIGAAIPGLKALVSARPAVILASVDRTVELTVDEVAAIVGVEVEVRSHASNDITPKPTFIVGDPGWCWRCPRRRQG